MNSSNITPATQISNACITHLPISPWGVTLLDIVSSLLSCSDILLQLRRRIGLVHSLADPSARFRPRVNEAHLVANPMRLRLGDEGLVQKLTAGLFTPEDLCSGSCRQCVCEFSVARECSAPCKVKLLLLLNIPSALITSCNHANTVQLHFAVRRV